MKSTEDAVFAVTFGCRNCGASFDHEYGERTRVIDKGSMGRVKVSDKDCNVLGGCDCCVPVKCPACDLYSEVYVDDRQPIEEEYQ